MTTIDKLDLSVYNLYAIRTKMIEQINQQMRLSEASTIPPQTTILDIQPKLTELDILLGIVPMYTPWAFFFPPPRLKYNRRPSFTFFRVIPSLGSLEEQAEEEEKLNRIQCNTPDEEKEKETLKTCFAQINKLNGWLGYIVGRVGQFLQG